MSERRYSKYVDKPATSQYKKNKNIYIYREGYT